MTGRSGRSSPIVRYYFGDDCGDCSRFVSTHVDEHPHGRPDVVFIRCRECESIVVGREYESTAIP